MLLTLLWLIFKLAIIGVIVWLITTYLPMPDIFKTLIYIIVAIAVVAWVLSTYGGYLSGPTFAPTHHR